MKPIALLLITILVFAGCSDEDSTTASSQTVKIGALYPLSGPVAPTGAELKAAIELANEVAMGTVPLPLPANSGRTASKRKIEVIFKDYGDDPRNAAAAVEELVKKDGVSAIIGCYQSAASMVASEKAEVLGIPFLNAESTAPLLTARGFKWFFRTTPDDDIFVQNFFSFLKEAAASNPGIPHNIALVYENQAWGTGVAQAEKRAAAENGFTVVADVPYDATKTDFSVELKTIANAMPAIILQVSYDADAVAFTRGYLGEGIPSSSILAMDGGFISSSYVATMGTRADGVLTRDVFFISRDGGSALVKEVDRLLKARTGSDLNGNSARAFTGFMVLADAVKRAKSTKPEDIRQALLETDIPKESIIMPWDGIRFDPATGQNTKGRGIIEQMREGRYVPVWPAESAQTEVRWTTK
jgi:branched-chain amino acid transport system substrate-binding protein